MRMSPCVCPFPLIYALASSKDAWVMDLLNETNIVGSLELLFFLTLK